MLYVVCCMLYVVCCMFDVWHFIYVWCLMFDVWCLMFSCFMFCFVFVFSLFVFLVGPFQDSSKICSSSYLSKDREEHTKQTRIYLFRLSDLISRRTHNQTRIDLISLNTPRRTHTNKNAGQLVGLVSANYSICPYLFCVGTESNKETRISRTLGME